MSKALYGVYGASGYGREVMPLAREQLERRHENSARLVFVDDAPSLPTVNGHPVWTYEEFLAYEADARHIVIAIADGHIREDLAVRCASDGVRPWTVRAGNVVQMDEVELGDGAILSPFVTLTSNIVIGRHFHANIYSYVAHDCVVGDFVTFAPSVKCNGNIVVEDHVYLGTGAVIKPGRPGRPLLIARGAVVGMGAVVTKDVLPGETVVGNPAKPLFRS